MCRHFFRVGTYSRNATFHISIIPNWWYLNTNIQPNDLLQQHPSFPVCGATQGDVTGTGKSIVSIWRHIRNYDLKKRESVLRLQKSRARMQGSADHSEQAEKEDEPG